MIDGTPRHPIPPKDAGFQAARPDGRFSERPQIVLPDTVPQTALDVWGPEAIRIHGVEEVEGNTIGYFNVNEDLVAFTRSLGTIEGLNRYAEKPEVSVEGFLTAEKYVPGHFGGLLEQFSVFPGHFHIHAATPIVIAGQRLPIGNPFADVSTLEISEIDFVGVAKPGDSIRYSSRFIRPTWETDGSYSIDASVGEKKIASINDIKIGTVSSRLDRLPAHELAEVAVQGLAVAGFGSEGIPVDENGQPIALGVFRKISGIQVYRDVLVGDRLTIIPLVERKPINGKGRLLSGKVSIVNKNDEPVAHFENLQAFIVPWATAVAQLS